MTKKVGVNVKIDKELKEQFFELCSDLNITASSIMNIYASIVVNRKCIPFDVSIDPFYSESNMRYLKKIFEDVKEGKAHYSEHDLIDNDDQVGNYMSKGKKEIVNISIRMDENLKKDFENICEELGVTVSAAFTILIKKMVREKRVPFPITNNPFYKKSEVSAMDFIDEKRPYIFEKELTKD